MKYLRHVLKEATPRFSAEKFPGVYTPLDLDEAKDMLSPYKNIILRYGDIKIYRGINAYEPYEDDILFGDGTKLVRKSANTTNFYTNMMTYELPKWKPFPRRDKSFIASVTTATASAYGGLSSTWVCIPLENQNIGICPAYDIWESFPKVHKYFDSERYKTNLATLCIAMRNIADVLTDDLDSNLLQDYTPEKYKDFLEKGTELLRDTPENSERLKKLTTKNFLFRDMAKFINEGNGHTLYEMVVDILDPTEFEILTTQQYHTMQSRYEESENEVWFSGKVMFIRFFKLAEILKAVAAW